MEGAPKIPTHEEIKNAAERIRRARDLVSVIIGSAIAATSPISKVTKAPTTETPMTAEKLVVRPKDMDDAALKDEIEQRKAVFEINNAGEIKRIQASKNSA